MERILMGLSLTDEDVARDIETTPPPQGVSVLVQHGVIQATEPAQIVSSVLIDFSVGIAASVVGNWLYACLTKRGKKSTKINREEVALQKREVLRFVKEQITYFYRRCAQEQEGGKKTAPNPMSRTRRSAARASRKGGRHRRAPSRRLS
jgi:hypothetical protein